MASIYGDVKSREWGNLAGYSYGSVDMTEANLGNYSSRGPYTNKWRIQSKYAKTWMNDGIANESARARKMAYWKKFDRFYSIDLEHEVPSGRHYIFILRPDLYLVKDPTSTKTNNGGVSSQIFLADDNGVSKDPFFNYLANMHPEIIASLTGDFAGIYGEGELTDITSGSAASGSGFGNARTSDNTRLEGQMLPIHTFIPYLTSRIETLQLPDFIVKTGQITQPYTKYTIPYAQSAIESTTGGNFSITFREDRYYSIHKMFYAWIYYQDRVMRNIFQPKKKYLQYNSLDYATSIYDFVVDETGENIVYWAKYTGCIPTNVPMGDLSFNKGSSGAEKVSIDFSYFYCEHMDANVLRDFQYNSLGYIYMKRFDKDASQLRPCGLDATEPMYNAADRLGPNLTGRPVIILTEDPGSTIPVIKLRWLKDMYTTKTQGRAVGNFT